MKPPLAHSYGIYVHVPWCRARCPYCAFNIEVDPDPDTGGWLRALLRAWAVESSFFTGPAHSLYLGGGTPSLLPPSVVASLVDALPLEDRAEVTLEANPGTVDLDDLRAFKDAGVTRLSIGVQSLQQSVARRLGRGHTVQQAADLLDVVDTAGFDSWSMDLIFAVPGESLDELEADLKRIEAVEPPHVSLYGLTIEPETPFAALQADGALQLPDAETWRAQYDRIVQRLTEGGWERYEVSNFAKPGHRGRHNDAIWRGGHYAGLGPSAHGFRPDRTRTTTEHDVACWMADPVAEISRPTDPEAAVDHILSTMRHVEGTRYHALHTASGLSLSESTVDKLCETGLIAQDQGGIHLTPDGFPLADGIVRELCAALSP